MPMQWRLTVRFRCDVRVAPACRRRARGYSLTNDTADDRQTLRDAWLDARLLGWRIRGARRARAQQELHFTCPLCAALRPAAGPPELRVVPDPADAP
jgi:hypothetical protein